MKTVNMNHGSLCSLVKIRTVIGENGVAIFLLHSSKSHVIYLLIYAACWWAQCMTQHILFENLLLNGYMPAIYGFGDPSFKVISVSGGLGTLTQSCLN